MASSFPCSFFRRFSRASRLSTWLATALILLSTSTFAHDGHGTPIHVHASSLFAIDAILWWVGAVLAIVALLAIGALFLRSSRKRAG